MTRDELITKQQLEIEESRAALNDNAQILDKLHGQFYAIGAPLNDNVLQFNKEQMKWCFDVVNLIQQINSAKVPAFMLDIPEGEEVVVLKGSLGIKESANGKYCLILSTPAMDVELTIGSFMHCSDIQSEITAVD